MSAALLQASAAACEADEARLPLASLLLIVSAWYAFVLFAFAALLMDDSP